MIDDIEMVFSFPDQSQSFTDGYHAGMIAQRILNGEALIDLGFEDGFPIQEQNSEVLKRMATAYGYAIEFGEIEYAPWLPVRLTKAEDLRPTLSVVK